MAPLLFILLFILSFFSPTKPDLNADKSALLSFSLAVGKSNLDWNSSSSPCTWRGVVCEAGRVAILRLPGANLRGEIPYGSLGNLTRLRTLSLRYNRLNGQLPTDITFLEDLRNLYLQKNFFDGQIPPSISNLRNLVRLNLAGNEFSGEIPSGMAFLNRMRSLSLENNKLVGQILDFRVNFEQFNVSYNNLSGRIPRSLRSMPENSFLGLDVCGLETNPCPDEDVAPSPPPVSSDGKKNDNKKLSAGEFIGIVIGSLIGLILILLLLLFFLRGKRQTRTISAEVVYAGAAQKADVAGELNAVTKDLVFTGTNPRSFGLNDMLLGSPAVLGKGTFGSTYAVALADGPVLAIKRLNDSRLLEEDFSKKVDVLGAMVHPNLVSLRAYYRSSYETLLIYDYLSGGSLFALLHGNKAEVRPPLNWHRRMEIAVDVARGIEYIHSRGPTISHGNLKSSNVLFVAEGSPAMISEHGLMQLSSAVFSPRRRAGYKAPELRDEKYTTSQPGDVFSFGVLLLELLTGKAPEQALVEAEKVELHRWVQSVAQDSASKVFDPKLLLYRDVKEDMILFLQLAVDCTAQIPVARPTMYEVVIRIEKIRHDSARSG